MTLNNNSPTENLIREKWEPDALVEAVRSLINDGSTRSLSIEEYAYNKAIRHAIDTITTFSSLPAETSSEAVSLLDKMDREYNRKTNDLIARHADAITAHRAQADRDRARIEALERAMRVAKRQIRNGLTIAAEHTLIDGLGNEACYGTRAALTNPEPAPVTCSWCGSDEQSNFDGACAKCGTETAPVAVEGDVWVWLSPDGRVRSASNEAPSADHLAAAKADGDRIVPFTPRADLAPTGNTALVEAAQSLVEACKDIRFAKFPSREEYRAIDSARGAIISALASREAALQPAAPQPTGNTALVEVTDAMIEAGLAEYSEGGCMGLGVSERRDVVSAILEAALSTRPAEATSREGVGK